MDNVSAEAATLAFYDRNAEAYATSTVGLDMSVDHDRFLRRLPPGGLILDAGSASTQSNKKGRNA